MAEEVLLPTRTLLGLLVWAQGLPVHWSLQPWDGHVCPPPLLALPTPFPLPGVLLMTAFVQINPTCPHGLEQVPLPLGNLSPAADWTASVWLSQLHQMNAHLSCHHLGPSLQAPWEQGPDLVNSWGLWKCLSNE